MANIIRTERLTLKIFDGSSEHYDNALLAIQEMAQDYAEGAIPPVPRTREEIDKRAARHRFRGLDAKLLPNQTICIYLGDEFIGVTHLAHRWSKYPDIGWFIRKPYEGQGYASEAGKATLEFWYSTVGIKEMYAAIDPGNKASIRIAEKCGLRYNGTIIVNREHGARQTMSAYMLPGMEAFPDGYEVDEKTGPHLN